MLKTICFILLVLPSFNLAAQEDTLELVLSSIPSADPKASISIDSTKSEMVRRHFLCWTTDVIYSDSIKRHKIVQKRRFFRNMFTRNVFDRRTNIKFKSWDENGRLISKSTVKPYGTDGKKRSRKYTYYENGKVKSKSINVKKGGCFLLVTKRSDVKEFDERGKRIRDDQP